MKPFVGDFQPKSMKSKRLGLRLFGPVSSRENSVILPSKILDGRSKGPFSRG